MNPKPLTINQGSAQHVRASPIRDLSCVAQGHGIREAPPEHCDEQRSFCFPICNIMLKVSGIELTGFLPTLAEVTISYPYNYQCSSAAIPTAFSFVAASISLNRGFSRMRTKSGRPRYV